MGVGFASYEIARSGLFVSERALNVTGHNISNVNTPGYVRQQAVGKTSPYQNTYTAQGLNQLGLGADIQEVRQIRNAFLDNIFRQESTTLGYWETRQKTFQDIEAVLAEPMQAGLQDALNSFWDAWQELSKEPESLTIRALVRQRAESLVQYVNHLGAQLDSLQRDLNSEIVVRIDEINQITSQIAKLNLKIKENEVAGDSANDYRDQRNLLIDRLSRLVNAEVTEMHDGQVDITLGGYYLVQKSVSTNLYAGVKNPGDTFFVPKLEGTDTVVPVRSGILKGLMEGRGEVSGMAGSFSNGSPNTKIDVVFAVDSSSGITPDTACLNAYKAELLKRGIDCTVTLVNFSPSGTDISESDIAGVMADPSVVSALRNEANKYIVVFSEKDTADAAAMADYLKNSGIELSAVTLSSSSGWGSVVSQADGSVYGFGSTPDISDIIQLMNTIAADTNADVNENISVIPESSNILSDLRARLNAMINILVREVNYLHRSGWTIGNPPTSGEDFFTAVNPGLPLEMGNIRLNPNLDNLNNIAASLTSDSGDNSNALRIADLRNARLIQDIGSVISVDEYYQSIILAVGNRGAEAVNIAESQQKLVETADSYRTSITGVSMDEEMANMLKYKFAYDASARTLNVIDSMLDLVINRMGIAGR